MKVRPMGSFPYTRSFRQLAFAALACEERLRPEDGCSFYATLSLYRWFEYLGFPRIQPTNALFLSLFSSFLLPFFFPWFYFQFSSLVHSLSSFFLFLLLPPPSF